VNTVNQRGLPPRAASLVARWGLVLEGRFPETPGSPGNFVVCARRADGTRCVLKVGQRVDETRPEIAALRVFAGRGAARGAE